MHRCVTSSHHMIGNHPVLNDCVHTDVRVLVLPELSMSVAASLSPSFSRFLSAAKIDSRFCSIIIAYCILYQTFITMSLRRLTSLILSITAPGNKGTNVATTTAVFISSSWWSAEVQALRGDSRTRRVCRARRGELVLHTHVFMEGHAAQ